MIDNSFLDRLARALYLYKTSDAELSEANWDNVPRSEYLYWQLLASAALNGIREPTPFMVEKGGVGSDVIWRRMVDAASSSANYDITDLDPTIPVPSPQVEDAFRRGYQQGASVMFGAVDRHLPEDRQKKLKDWIGKTLFNWRYDSKSKKKKQIPPFPPFE